MSCAPLTSLYAMGPEKGKLDPHLQPSACQRRCLFLLIFWGYLLSLFLFPATVDKSSAQIFVTCYGE